MLRSSGSLRFALDAGIGQPSKPSRQPPVPVGEECHDGGHEHRAHDRGIEQDSDSESKPELLQCEPGSGCKRVENDDHDECRTGDDLASAVDADSNGFPVVMRDIVVLANAAQDGNVVVHAETEQDAEEKDRNPGFDNRAGMEAEETP